MAQGTHTTGRWPPDNRMPPYSACTIVSNNYLAFARVFARSFLAHHPNGRVWTLIVDRPDPTLLHEDEPFEAVYAQDLGIPKFENFAFRYSILELNTAVKPYFLELLHREWGCDQICYFDPDILVTGDLSPIYRALEEAEVVLTPHILAPLEDDGYPSEREFLLSGIYNLGFLGISMRPTTLDFLGWWQRRLYHHCVHRTDRGLFVDQRWMDFAPALLTSVEILHDPGYNVAYWNLPHRELEAREGGYLVGGSPLRFFHFSGIDVDDPEQISKFQDRYTLADRPDVRPLFLEYRRALKEEGFDELRRIPYAYDRFRNDVAVPAVARLLLQKLDPDGERWANPFDSEAPNSYHGWLWEPVEATHSIRLPRLALALWDLRTDLQAAFPFPLAADAQAYARWFIDEVHRTPELDASLAQVVESSLEKPRPRPSRRVDRSEATPPLFTQLVSRTRTLGWRMSRHQLKWWASSGDLDGVDEERRPVIPRLALMIRDRRSDLEVSFPDPLGRSRLDFALWFVTFGRLEYKLPGRVVRRVLRTLPLRQRLYALLWWLRHGLVDRLRKSEQGGPGRYRPERAELKTVAGPSKAGTRIREPGVNVIGWRRSPTGVGEVCRGTLLALREAGLPHGVCGLKHPALDQGDSLIDETSSLDVRLPITLYHVNADMMEHVRRQLPLVLTSSEEFAIGYWFWELSHFPLQFAKSFGFVDEVWAPSRFCERALTGLSPVEVRWVPPAVRAPEPLPVDRAELGIAEEDFVFFFAFDALSIPERKNPLDLLRVFERVASRSTKPTRLLLKVSHAHVVSDYVREIRRYAEKLPVTFLDGSVSRGTLLGLFALSDAYVSLHRSEGLGLPLIEAMYLGKPVLATSYGGCTDFLDESTGWPLEYRLEALDRDHGPYPKGAIWAAPDCEHAEEMMLEVLRHPEASAERVCEARRRVQELYSPRAAGERFRLELGRILERIAN